MHDGMQYDLIELENQAKLFGKQHMISLISRWPNFMKFEHSTLIGVAMNMFGTEFGKFNLKGLFVKKQKNSF